MKTKNLFKFLLACIAVFGNAYCECDNTCFTDNGYTDYLSCNEDANNCCKPGNTVAIRTGAFFPVDSDFRKIYAHVSEFYELEFSQKCNDQFVIWENIDWFSRSGRSIGLHDYTRISIANFSGGIKFNVDITDCFLAYIGIGASIGGLWIKDDLRDSKHKTNHRCIWGGVIKTGVNYYFAQNWFIDLFADYLYEPHRFYRQVDFGGLRIGGGLGYAF